MAYTRTWNAAYEASPAGSDFVSTVDDRMRELKVDIRERMVGAGQVWQNADIANELDGRHAVEATGGGTPSPDVYKSDLTTKLVTFSDTNVAISEDLDVTGDVTGGNVDSGTNPGHGHEVTLLIPLIPTGTGRISGAIFHNLGNGVLTIKEGMLVAFGAPSGGSLVITAEILASSYTDPSTDSGTLVFSGGDPTLGDGVKKGSAVSSFNDDTLAEDEAMVFNCTTYNASASEVYIVLKVERA